jgi:hypothetical protein
LLRDITAGRGPAGRATVLGLRPAGPEVSRLERDAAALKAAASRGFEAVMQAFDANSLSRIPS